MNRSTARSAPFALALLAVALLAVACDPAHTEPPTGDPARGQALWAQSACSACHGSTAEGAQGGPSLVDTPLSLHDVTGLVRRGTVNMPAFGAEQLGDQDLADMFAWWHDPSAVGSADAGVCADACPAPTTAAGDISGPASTAALAQNPWPLSPCAGCHGASAQGGIGPALAGTALDLAAFRSTVRRGPGSMPAYSAAELSDQAVQALYDALRGPAAPPATSAAPVAGSTAAVPLHPWLRVGCAECHGQRAEGGTGPTLAGEDWEYAKFQRKVREGDGGMPAFGTDQVSDADLQVIYNWLLAGAPAP